MNQPRRGRPRNNRFNQQTRQGVHSAAPSWYLNPNQSDTQYNSVADQAEFGDNVFQPSQFDYYSTSLDLFPDDVALPSISYTLNDDENQLEHPARGGNALSSPFQLRTPPNITQLMGDPDIPSGFDIGSQNGSTDAPNEIKREVAQLQLELANVKDSVMSLQSE
jgi:hypothetical protein